MHVLPVEHTAREREREEETHLNTQLSGVQHRNAKSMLSPCCGYRHSVERLLDSVDAVVYILDYTKLKTQEEAELLTKLSKSNPQLIMRLAQRLFFVVNKIDVMHVSEGLDEDELREYVADVVTKQMNFTTFQLRPEQVCPLSFPSLKPLCKTKNAIITIMTLPIPMY